MLARQVWAEGGGLVFAAPIEHILTVDALQFSATSLFSSFRISQLSVLVLILPCP